MKLTGITPNLVTDDVERSVAFYCGVLDFKVITRVPDEGPAVFAMLDRDGVMVFVNSTKAVKEDLPDVQSLIVGKSGIAMFFVVEGITAFWDSIKDRATVVMPLKDQWYGMTEFSVTDPDGYVITFAERKTGA